MSRFTSAWIRQCKSELTLHGPDRAAWEVRWKEPDGRKRSKRCGCGTAGKKLAQRLATKIRAELLTGTYKLQQSDIPWVAFTQLLREKVYDALKPTTCREMMDSLQRFGKIVNPRRVATITTQDIATFTAKRREQRGVKPESKVSANTINKDLRHLRTALRIAHDWGYLETIPKFRMVPSPTKLPRYVVPEHFTLIYQACDTARMPASVNVPPADWWRALLVMAQMTGWRIGELLALQWDDVDLDAGTAVTRHRDNKVRRDDKVPLHPLVVEHLKPLRSFDRNVFPFDHARRTLYSEFYRIQEAAEVHLPCPDEGESGHGKCTPACNLYSFHDERRAFATLNALSMAPYALQTLMRHRSLETTTRYINMARQLNPVVANLHLPELRAAGG